MENQQLVKTALEIKLDSHITQDVFSGNKNRKNGKTSAEIEERILSMYGWGRVCKIYCVNPPVTF